MRSVLEDLPLVLTKVFRRLSRLTDWKFSCMMAGPDPAETGISLPCHELH